MSIILKYGVAGNDLKRIFFIKSKIVILNNILNAGSDGGDDQHEGEADHDPVLE